MIFLCLVSTERWCRLRGNLLFYYKSRDAGSQPAGVIVLENLSISDDNNSIDGTHGLLLTTGQHRVQRLRFYSAEDRNSWKSAIDLASNSIIKAKISSLQHHIAKRLEAEGLRERDSNVGSKSLHDPSLQPYLSCCFSCDSLPSDSSGAPLKIR